MTRSGIAQRRSSSLPSSPILVEPEPAAQDLLVAREVVRALDALDPEAPVLAAPRPALLEHDHAADRLGALEVRDVVALDAHRRSGQAEGLGQLLERGQRLALVGQPAGLLARQRLAGVACRQLHQLAPLAALRDVEADVAARACRSGTPRGRRRPAAGTGT